MDYPYRLRFGKASLKDCRGQGKEAVTVRQLFLVIILVAASFLGGAFVNGPGLQWAQARIIRSLSLTNSGEIASVNLNPDSSSEISSDKALQVKLDAETSPALQTSALSSLTESKSSKQDLSASSFAQRGTSKVTRNASASTDSRPLSAQILAKHLAAATSSRPEHTMLSDSSIKPTGGTTSATSHKSSSSDSEIAPDILDSLVRLLPTNAPPSGASPSSLLEPSAKPTIPGANSWAILERKMQSLGVTRYTIDGEPGGQIVFSCLIPIAGRQAITERFEAVGDDIEHAVQAGLRRISLWRATQPTSP